MTRVQDLQVFVQNCDYGNRVDFAVVRGDSPGERAVLARDTSAAPELVYTFQPIDPAANYEPVASFSLPKDSARALMDRLWEQGVRPTELGGPAHVGAVERHLADMRKIAFDLLSSEERTNYYREEQ